jgi:hypothetical protein
LLTEFARKIRNCHWLRRIEWHYSEHTNHEKKPLDLAGFLKLVIDALGAAGVDYLIGGAIAEWAWEEPRATQDLDLVVKIPIKSTNKLSKELEKRDMLIPAEIILDTILEDRADIPINAIHMHSGLKADSHPVWLNEWLNEIDKVKVVFGIETFLELTMIEVTNKRMAQARAKGQRLEILQPLIPSLPKR